MAYNDLRINTKKWIGAGALLLATLAGVGCRQDMHNQPKFKPLRISDFYADKRSSRPIITGTVARGQLQDDTYYYTGKIGNQLGTEMPFPVTQEVLERGRQRYNIYCSPCHSEVGDGNGMIVQRGFKRPPSYHIDRLRTAPVGHFFDVISNGFGAMSEYSIIPVHDRWAIVAYIRALQLSQGATRNDVPAGTQISDKAPDLTAKPLEQGGMYKGTHGEAGTQGEKRQ